MNQTHSFREHVDLKAIFASHNLVDTVIEMVAWGTLMSAVQWFGPFFWRYRRLYESIGNSIKLLFCIIVKT